jgi:hypothetical protein
VNIIASVQGYQPPLLILLGYGRGSTLRMSNLSEQNSPNRIQRGSYSRKQMNRFECRTHSGLEKKLQRGQEFFRKNTR